MKVSEYLRDSHDPRGNAGASVDIDIALRIAGEMRQLLNMDLEEIDIALAIQIFNRQLDQDEHLAAWEYLNAGERGAWKKFVAYESYLREQERKRAD